ncbi:hypothetical protein CMI37_05825 [Candidatus Pacearchaeota archaeon]|nr:hypothetical protein [Candidatus Pacearchaeota archaeon]|tara:strand:+ start:4324 stop:4545 length:222 start_codon:yes stop_codon:yes gene_type:complete
MEYNVYFDDILSMSISAKNRKDAWKQLFKAGFKNKSKMLKLKETNFDTMKLVTNIVGNKEIVLPSKQSIKFER